MYVLKRDHRAHSTAHGTGLANVQRACASAHRGMLEQTIAEIDRQLAALA
jgi:hypothetical protein